MKHLNIYNKKKISIYKEEKKNKKMVSKFNEIHSYLLNSNLKKIKIRIKKNNRMKKLIQNNILLINKKLYIENILQNNSILLKNSNKIIKNSTNFVGIKNFSTLVKGVEKINIEDIPDFFCYIMFDPAPEIENEYLIFRLYLKEESILKMVNLSGANYNNNFFQYLDKCIHMFLSLAGMTDNSENLYNSVPLELFTFLGGSYHSEILPYKFWKIDFEAYSINPCRYYIETNVQSVPLKGYIFMVRSIYKKLYYFLKSKNIFNIRLKSHVLMLKKEEK
jgi:hypothetical protein